MTIQKILNITLLIALGIISVLLVAGNLDTIVYTTFGLNYVVGFIMSIIKTVAIFYGLWFFTVVIYTVLTKFEIMPDNDDSASIIMGGLATMGIVYVMIKGIIILLK